jgi:hypothetical protein
MEMVSEQTAMEQSRIVRVEAFDGDTFGITLERGHTVLLELEHRIKEPAFAALIESGDFCKPYTDGKAICWPSGVSITLEEILDMLLSRGDAAQNQNNYEEE